MAVINGRSRSDTIVEAKEDITVIESGTVKNRVDEIERRISMKSTPAVEADRELVNFELLHQALLNAQMDKAFLERNYNTHTAEYRTVLENIETLNKFEKDETYTSEDFPATIQALVTKQVAAKDADTARVKARAQARRAKTNILFAEADPATANRAEGHSGVITEEHTYPRRPFYISAGVYELPSALFIAYQYAISRSREKYSDPTCVEPREVPARNTVKEMAHKIDSRERVPSSSPML